MKKAYAFIGILFAAIFTTYLTAEDREGGDRERNKVDFEKIAIELKKAVAEGKISEEDARRRLDALRERVGREQNRKPNVARAERDRDAGQDELRRWAEQQERHIHELRRAGRKEEAEKALENLKRTLAKHREHRETNERGEREHHEDPLKRWSQQRSRQIEELAKAGKHEEARELERETKRIVEERMRHRHEEERERHNREPGEHGERDHNEDPLERWVHERERAIQELAEDGRHEEAKALQQETRRIIEEKLRHRRNEERERHERESDERRARDHDEEGNEFERWAHQQKRHIHELRENNQHEEAERVERELAEKMEHFHRQREREHGEREQHEGNRHRDERVHQLMVAIEHLRAAGMHDLAEEVERRAHGDHNRREHREDDRGDGNNELNQLRGEVDELRRAMREMREFIGRQQEERNSPPPPPNRF